MLVDGLVHTLRMILAHRTLVDPQPCREGEAFILHVPYGAIYLHTPRQSQKKPRARGLTGSGRTGYNWLPFTHASDNALIRPLAKIESLLRLRRLPAISPWVLVSAHKPQSSAL